MRFSLVKESLCADLLSSLQAYAGMSFAAAAQRVFNDTHGNVLLIGVEVLFCSSGYDPQHLDLDDARVLLNPGRSLITTQGMQCYVIADDLEHVGGISDEEVTAETIRRPDVTPTILRATQAETFVEADVGVGEEEEAHAEDEMMSPHTNLKSSFSGGFAAAVESVTSFVPLIATRTPASQETRDSLPAQLRRSNGARMSDNVVVVRNLFLAVGKTLFLRLT
ncbi:hypothetical protein PINS_up014250 [Pythium insidiosum]|nr:hypothetical protein PINS_up014250 [Pythium insidiosum]